MGAGAAAGDAGSLLRSRRDLRRAASVSSRVGDFFLSIRSTLILRFCQSAIHAKMVVLTLLTRVSRSLRFCLSGHSADP